MRKTVTSVSFANLNYGDNDNFPGVSQGENLNPVLLNMLVKYQFLF